MYILHSLYISSMYKCTLHIIHANATHYLFIIILRNMYYKYIGHIFALFIPCKEAKKISNSLQRMRGNCERKKIENSNVSKLELKHIILYFKFWLLKTSIRGNFNYKYFHPSFSKYPFSKIKSSIASSLSKDLFLGVKSYILDL